MARKVKKAKEEEFKEYLKLRKESMEYISKISGENLKLSDKKIKEEFLEPISNKKNKIFFLKEDNQVRGYINVLFINRNGVSTSYLNDIVISEDSKRKGHGEYLMEEFIKISKRKGADRIGLGARVENTSAINLYKKLGFKVIGYNFGMNLK